MTGGYTKRHKAYDFDDIPDKNYCSSLYGKVVLSKNSETKNWRNTGKLTTRDYGNYIKIKGEVNGKTIFQLGAHFQSGTVLPKGTEVKAGQVVAQAGKTGNIRPMHGGDGSHSHTEYRDSDEKNFAVKFVDSIENGEEDKTMEKLLKNKVIEDVYKALRGGYPEQDEVNRWLQENKNIAEIIEEVMKGDEKVKPRWLEIWKVKDEKDEESENFKQTVDDFMLIMNPLGVRLGDKTETGKATMSKAIKELLVLRDKEMPEPKIIVAEEEFTYIVFLGLIFGFKKRGDNDEEV